MRVWQCALVRPFGQDANHTGHSLQFAHKQPCLSCVVVVCHLLRCGQQCSSGLNRLAAVGWALPGCAHEISRDCWAHTLRAVPLAVQTHQGGTQNAGDAARCDQNIHIRGAVCFAAQVAACGGAGVVLFYCAHFGVPFSSSRSCATGVRSLRHAGGHPQRTV